MGFLESLQGYFKSIKNVETNIYAGKQDYYEVYEKNLQLEKEITKRTEELDTANKHMLTLKHIAEMMNSSSPLSNVLNKIVNTLHGDLGYLHCEILQKKKDERGEYLSMIAYSDSDICKRVNSIVGTPIYEQRIPYNENGIAAQIFKSKKIHQSTDLRNLLYAIYPNLPTSKADDLLDNSICSSYIFVPLFTNNDSFGLMTLYSPRDEITERERNFLDLFAQQIEQAVTIAGLFQVVREQAVTDSLTGLYNRRYFEEFIKKEAMRAVRQNQKFTIIGLDLDHLKTINDKYGHSFGDLAIKTVAEVLQSNARAIDVAARMGGEEFNIVLPGVDSQGGLKAAERLRKAIENSTVEGVGKITASIGVATFPDHSEELDELLELTDQAMYISKRNGRNQVTLANHANDLSWQEIAIETFVNILSKHRIPVEQNIANKLCKKLEDLDVNKEVLFFVSDKLAQIYNPNHAEGQTKSKVLLATTLAKRFDLSKEDTDKLKIAMLLYDIGNLMIPIDILRKETPLTEEELLNIKQHPVIAAREILKPISKIGDIIPIVEHHHENWDGTGYPNNVSGDLIPIESQIVLIIDAYFALIEQRPYRNALSKSEAIEVIRESIGKKWSENLVNEFIALIEIEN